MRSTLGIVISEWYSLPAVGTSGSILLAWNPSVI